MEKLKSDVLNIDCMEYMQTLPDNAFTLALIDPPYGISADKPSPKPKMIKQKNGRYLQAKLVEYGKKDWDIQPPQEFFDEVMRVSEKQIIWGANYFGLKGGMLVWDKMNSHCDQFGCEIAWLSFSRRTDIVHYLWQGMLQGAICSSNARIAEAQQGNKALNEKRIHPTQKPVALYAWMLEQYAQPGDRIFDPMMGSQSSRIAAYKLGLDFVGCELDPEYFTKGCERFDEECKGIVRLQNGTTATQKTLFENI